MIMAILPMISSAQSPLDEDGFQFSLAGGYSNKGIPINLSFELGVHEDITGGVQGIYRIYSEDADSTTYSHTIMGLGFFGNYYFNDLVNLDPKKWGLYAGINFTFYKWFSPDESVDVQSGTSTLAVGIQLGGRYYFAKNFAIYLEGQAGSENLGGVFGVSYRIPY